MQLDIQLYSPIESGIKDDVISWFFCGKKLLVNEGNWQIIIVCYVSFIKKRWSHLI